MSSRALREGYAAKVLAPEPTKCAGHKTLLPLLGAFGSELVLVEDPDALARIQSRMEPADRERQRFNNRNHETARAKQMSEAPKYKLVAADGRNS